MNATEIASLIIIVGSAGLPVLCSIKMKIIQRFKAKSITTNALITQVEKRSGQKSTYYILSLQYKNVDTGISFKGHMISASKRYKVGDTVPLMYLPDKPEIYKTDFGKWLRWIFAFSLCVFGAIMWFCYWLLHLNYTNQY